MGTRRLQLLALAAATALAAGCTGSAPDDRAAGGRDAGGPAEVRVEVVDEHARQFDEDLADRRAGSQQEFAAATYITAHLQDAGYRVALKSVPFEDLVRSTNVVALPPGGADPSAVVTVAYDTTESSPPLGREIGLFLELARALRAVDPDHQVQFVALAAELTSSGGGNLGSRALAGELNDVDPKPPVISVMEVDDGGFRAPGPGGDDLNEIALSMDIPLARPLSEPILPMHLRSTTVFVEAGFEHAVAAGGVEEVGRVLLAFLRDAGR